MNDDELANLKAALAEIQIKREWERRRLGFGTDEELLEWQINEECAEHEQAHIDAVRAGIEPLLCILRDNQPRYDGCDEARLDLDLVVEMVPGELKVALAALRRRR